jgi:hypothetical protein
MAEPNISNTKILISESGELVEVSGFSLSSSTRAKISESNIQRKGGVAEIGILPSFHRHSKSYLRNILKQKAEAELT